MSLNKESNNSHEIWVWHNMLSPFWGLVSSKSAFFSQIAAAALRFGPDGQLPFSSYQSHRNKELILERISW